MTVKRSALEDGLPSMEVLKKDCIPEGYDTDPEDVARRKRPRIHEKSSEKAKLKAVSEASSQASSNSSSQRSASGGSNRSGSRSRGSSGSSSSD